MKTHKLYQKLSDDACAAGIDGGFRALAWNHDRYIGHESSCLCRLRMHAAYGGVGPYAEASVEVKTGAVAEVQALTETLSSQ